MEFRSLEEFDRAFFAAYGTGDGYGEGDGMRTNPYDPFLQGAASPPGAKPNAKKKKQKQTPLQIVHAVISYIIIAFLVVAIVGFIAPLPFGVKMLNVQSGSMTPKYNVGTLVWVFPTAFDKIKVGNDVTYQLPTGVYSTHRVIEIDSTQQILTVQGIHASEFSEKINYGQVVGVVRFSIKGLGSVMDVLNGESGIYIKILIVLAVALLWGASFVMSKMKSGGFGGGNNNPNKQKQTGANQH